MSRYMKRLSLFFGALPFGSRLQILAVLCLLGYHAWIDYQLGIWPVTIVIIVIAWTIGWLMMPVMAAYPKQTFKIWGAQNGLKPKSVLVTTR